MAVDRAQTELEAANLGLSQARQPSISSLEETSQRARVVRLHFGTVRDDLLRAGRFNFATGWVTPARDGTDSPGDLQKRYPLPPDCLAVRSVKDLEQDEWQVEHGATSDPVPTQRKILVTNADAPVVCYTKRVTDVAAWDETFVRAFKFKLAEAIGPELARSQSITTEAGVKGDAATDQANIRDAREAAGSRVPRDTDWVRARRGIRSGSWMRR